MPQVRKHSHKRDAIYNTICSTSTHPTADWIYTTLRREIPDLSLGTVYRNLTLFQNEGLIRRVGVVNGQERYDANTADHPHFVCTGCGSVLDLDMHSVGVDASSVESENKVSVSRMDLTFYGQCAECNK